VNLALRYAWRELRGGGIASLRQFRIVLACLALGVGAIALVGTLRASLTRGIAEQGTALLGGDLAIDGSAEPFPDSLRTLLTSRGATLSEVVRMSSLIAAPDGERTLINLKSADHLYPLKGVVKLAPSQSIQAALANHGLVAEQIVFDRLRLKPGDTVRVGDSSFHLTAALLSQPDASTNLVLFGPTVLISADDLAATNLVVPGAMVDRSLRVALPAGVSARSIAALIQQNYPDQGYRLRTSAETAPGLDRTIDQVAQFLTLVGLASLLVGGIGVAVGIEAWLAARARSIAILRCLGASTDLIMDIYLIQSLALASLGILAGLFLGGVVPWMAGDWLASLLPVPAHFGIYPEPLLLAAFYGLLTTLVFALAPLGRATRLSGADLFRDSVLPAGANPSAGLLLTNAALILVLILVAVRTSGGSNLALGFAIGAVGTLVLFRGAGQLLTRVAARLPRPRNLALRLGLKALHRPGADTKLMLTALGLGLTSLAAIVCTEANLNSLIAAQIPQAAPSFFFIDIQPNQLDQFHAILAKFSSVRDVTNVPNLRARIVAVRGIPAAQFAANPQAGWAVRGDRGLTYAATPPKGTELTSGAWWPADYTGKPLLSLDDGLAQGLGVGVGDVIRLNILGREIDLTIANTRRIAWRSLSMNYAMVASPGLLSAAPHTNIATLRSDPAQDGAILRAVADALPNVTGIRVADVLATIATLVRKLATALAATGAIGLVSGGLVLAGAIAAGQQRRAREAVILKTLGATSGQIRLAFLVEFGLVGLVGGVLAGAIGSLASFEILTHVMNETWNFTPIPLLATLVISILVTLAFGLLSTRAALKAKPAAFLRNE
jgi:putative ABC transport system permease protein